MYLPIGVIIAVLTVLVVLVVLFTLALFMARASRDALQSTSLALGQQQQVLHRATKVIEESDHTIDQLFEVLDRRTVELRESLERESQMTELCRPWLESYGESLATSRRTLVQAWDKVAALIPSNLMDLRTIALIRYGEHTESMKAGSTPLELLPRDKHRAPALVGGPNSTDPLFDKNEIGPTF